MITSSQINPTESSNLLGFGYNKESKQLGVVFKSSPNSLYIYSNVPESLYEDMENAESKGSFFYNNFRKTKWEFIITPFEV